MLAAQCGKTVAVQVRIPLDGKNIFYRCFRNLSYNSAYWEFNDELGILQISGWALIGYDLISNEEFPTN